ncbi:putative integrase core domain protein [Rhizophagus clarus]|uniref:Putative integrase core domain protein n=1 Tax=Rhizophagus clarus TaxID=94130 RepID=A0A8H3KZM9_9GLOM|nr:putative integrase core domain protein [Rhizophagus clarus]
MFSNNHAALKGLMNAKILKGRRAKWVMELQQYDFEVIYRSGKKNKNADTLSRLKYEKDINRGEILSENEQEIEIGIIEIENNKYVKGQKWEDVKKFTDKKAILLKLEEKIKKKLLKRLRLRKEPQVIIIDGVDGVGKSTVVENIVKDLEREEKKIIFNKFKRRRQDDKRFEKPNKRYEWLFRKQVVEEINRRIIKYRDKDTKSFDRGLITPYGNHKMEEKIFKYKNIVDNAIIIFLENNRCWENYIGRENKKRNEEHKTSYETLDEESYREMMEKFQINQHLYEDVEKYKKVKIENDKKKEKYILKNDKLYRVNKGKEQLVIRRYEFEGLLYMIHNHELSGHFGINTTYEKIKEKYYWKNMFEDIKVYVKTYDSYQRRGKPDKKNELFLIKVKREPFYQIGIDFIVLLPVTERKNRYIIVAIDYFTKWPEAKATEKNNAEIVADLVERFNRTLYEALAKLGGNNEREARLPTDESNEKEDESRIDQLEIYQIEDKVLKYNTAKEKQWSGKLEEKWIGPYYVHEILINGSYKIKELNG